MAAADIVVKCEEFIDSEVHVEDANNTYFNVYEHHQDSEPENDENRREGSEYENDDIKMQELLREFDLEILYTLLKFGDITYRSLKYISENDINAAIRSIAYRAEFREKLFAWRRDKYGLNDYSVLPPPKNTPMPLGVNNSSNILTTNTNLNRNTNSPAPTMTTTTSTKQAPSSAAPRARRLSAPKTSAAKKARIAANQNASSKRASTASPPPPSSPTPNASRSINSPTQTLSEALSMLQHDNTTTSHPSMDFDDPLCFQPTTSSAAAAATTSASSAIIPTTDSLLFEPQPKMAISKLASSNVSDRPRDTTYFISAEIKKKIAKGEYKIHTRKGKSKVWILFGLIKNAKGDTIEDYVVCKNCSNVYKSQSGQTSNLFKHKCYVKAFLPEKKSWFD